MLIQSSVAELKQIGVYERYCRCLEPAALEEIEAHIGPGWLPVELAMAHYRACDSLAIDDAAVEQLGAASGDKLARTLLVSAANGGQEGSALPWSALGAFYRMGRRIYEGGSAQYVRLGPKQLLIENVGNPLLSVPYYRVAHLAFMRRAFGTLGVEIVNARITSYRAATATVEVMLAWT